jgi:hypothetical protein
MGRRGSWQGEGWKREQRRRRREQEKRRRRKREQESIAVVFLDEQGHGEEQGKERRRRRRRRRRRERGSESVEWEGEPFGNPINPPTQLCVGVRQQRDRMRSLVVRVGNLKGERERGGWVRKRKRERECE